ncbi:carboxypeptidase O-like [Anticarsia gemmatalis]|uniref:carboxypeptidase O-like n=1 Tax=Anticarsia gemmatalis TaxID=129554 RepID=UPI003F776FC2
MSGIPRSDFEETTHTHISFKKHLRQNRKKKKDMFVRTTSADNMEYVTFTKSPKLRSKGKHKTDPDAQEATIATRLPTLLQLREDEEKVIRDAETSTAINERLNPYAIEQQMRRVVDNCKGANITLEIIGRTIQYNNIVLLKMGEGYGEIYFRADKNYAEEPPEKRIIFIVYGLSVKGMRHLLQDESTFETLLDCYRSHLDKFDVYVIPMANPDGYAASINTYAHHYWNKNMSPQNACAGVALDRNFDVSWDWTLANNSCNALYPGPAPFSEPESRAGDAILYPPGYTDNPIDDDKYIYLRGEVEEAVRNTSFRVLNVAVENMYNWYGKVSGTSVDYASTVYGIPYAMEFVMQTYTRMQRQAIKKIWRPVIDVVLNNIWNYLNDKEDNNY